jgi:type IV pilus assembly protein PilV
MQLSARCRGFALIEALLALLILAFGMLSLLWTHQQALVSQRQQLMLSVAMGMADDFAERMRLNAPHRAAYAKGWGSSSPSVLTNCVATPCSRSELASWDLAQLQHSLQTQLPEGDAAVFQLTTPHGWGIVIAWRDASESYRTDSAAGSPACPAQMSCWRLLFRPDR